MGFIGKSVSLTLLSLFCFTSSVFTLGVNQPGSSSPIEQVTRISPTKAPLKLPTLPPAQAPIKLPTLPPAQAPIKQPTLPPAKAPIKLPTLPPAKAPIKLPTLPPAKAPIKVPTLPPAKAPIKPPVLPPVQPPKYNRTLVAVRGVVYCKACKYAGVDNLVGAKPVKGAVVRLLCKNKKNSTSETTTDENGYFMVLAPKTVSSYGIKSCRAFLVKSLDAKCNKVSTLHGAAKGAILKGALTPAGKGFATIIMNKLTYGVFNVGPFAFIPSCLK